jgi:hypothetical protein
MGFCCAPCWCRGMVHDPPKKERHTRIVILSEAKNPEDIATSFRTWIENSSAFFHHAGFQPHTQKGHAGGMSLQQWCNRIPASCPSCTFVDKKRRTGVRRDTSPVGRHGPRRDANTARCLFLLLLSLEESNQRTLRNRNARFNRRPARRRFRCVRTE